MIISSFRVVAFPGISNSACLPPTNVLPSTTYTLGAWVVSVSTKYPFANFTFAPAPSVAGLIPGISPVLGNTLKFAPPNPGAITVKVPLYVSGVAPLTEMLSPTPNPWFPSVLIVI